MIIFHPARHSSFFTIMTTTTSAVGTMTKTTCFNDHKIAFSWFLRRFIVATAAVFLTLSPFVQGQEECPPNRGLKIPLGATTEAANKFPFVEAGLQIFTNIKVPCEGGFLTQWRFIASGNFILGLHLAVFRRRWNNPRLIDLVDETYIHELRVPDEHVGYWVKYSPYRPIPVQAGDMVGIFYDRLYTPTEMLTILSKTCDKPNTYVFLMDQRNLNLINKTKGEVSFNEWEGISDCRKPALMAIVSGSLPLPPVDLTSDDLTLPTTTTPKWVKVPPAIKPILLEPTTTTTTTTPKPIITKITTVATTQLNFPKPAFMFITVKPPPLKAQYSFGYQSPDLPTNNNLLVNPTLPSPVVEGGQIPSKCYSVPSMLRTCYRETVRSYFDYREGACALFYGCETAREKGNNFNSLDECILTCEVHSQRYIDLSEVKKPPATTTMMNPPFIENFLLNKNNLLPPAGVPPNWGLKQVGKINQEIPPTLLSDPNSWSQNLLKTVKKRTSNKRRPSFKGFI